MDIGEFGRLVSSLEGIRQRSTDGMLRWQLNGRLVARQLDDAHVAIRAPFGTRDVLLHQFPGTFTVPPRLQKHMMVVADLAEGNRAAIEDAVLSAWRFQSQDP